MILTYKPYDLDKLLHRGKYSDGTEPPKIVWTPRTVFKKLIGITPEYTKGDRFIAYLVFFNGIGINLLILFFATVVWNAISPWPDHWWSIRYFITVIILQVITSLCSTVWFLIGGIHDLRHLFIDLGNRVVDDNDNGQVLKEQK